MSISYTLSIGDSSKALKSTDFNWKLDGKSSNKREQKEIKASSVTISCKKNKMKALVDLYQVQNFSRCQYRIHFTDPLNAIFTGFIWQFNFESKVIPHCLELLIIAWHNSHMIDIFWPVESCWYQITNMYNILCNAICLEKEDIKYA